MDIRLEKILFNRAEDLSKVISSGKTYLKNDSIIIFTCGARPDPKNPSGRDIFLDYAENHMPNYNFFMAEDFFKIFKAKGKTNLLSLEEAIADFSDCIVLILESESTYAELGAFAISDKLVEICLVVNEIKYKDSPSFINHGPIKKVNDQSKFGKVINTKLQSLTTSCNEIETRLQDQIKRVRDINIDLSDFDKFRNAIPKNRLLFLLDLISIFSPLKFSELIKILNFIYGNNDFKIHFERTLLEALDMIKTKDGYIYKTRKEMKFYYSYHSANIVKIRADIISNYHKYSRERMDYLELR